MAPQDAITLADLNNLARFTFPVVDFSGYLAPNLDAPREETQPCSICAGQGRTQGRKCYGCKGRGYLAVRVRTR